MKYLLFILPFLTIASCKDMAKSGPQVTTTDTEITDLQVKHIGKTIMETECYICHNPKVDQESMIAPPMIAIKKHYIGKNTSKEQFTQDLIKWVNDPEAETKMPGAQRRFGKMPYMPYPDEEIVQIAEYLYDYDIDEPIWFDAHFKNEHGNAKGMGKGSGKGKNQSGEVLQNSYVKTGMHYAMAAKDALGKNLMKSIQEKGTLGALEFCNVKALAITDSISQGINAQIKRVSDKPRNPKNTANTEELGYISYFKGLLASGTEPKPIIKKEGDKVHFYFPIATNAMCLQCHGQPNEQVQPVTMAKLQELYPSDKALGYSANEVRGIWAVSFDEPNIE